MKFVSYDIAITDVGESQSVPVQHRLADVIKYYD